MVTQHSNLPTAHSSKARPQSPSSSPPCYVLDQLAITLIQSTCIKLIPVVSAATPPKASHSCQNCAFELWCGRRLLRVPWTARRSNQSILQEISPEYLLEGLMLKLKLQYFGHLMQRTHWKRPGCWGRLKAGREGDDRGCDGWMASLTRWT